ncbi:hypothetical protein pb186bvf_008927 [Paramecium bursaria]
MKSQPLQPVNQNIKHQKKKSQTGKQVFDIGGTQFVVDDRYECQKQIGHGAYGVVCSGVDVIKNKKIAIKKIQNAFEDLVDAKRIVREIKLLQFFQHENIISLIDILRPDQRTGFNDIYIVTELMETDLHRVIYSRQDLTEEHIQYFMYQTLRGLLFLHSANVMHRDLKPSNILVNKNCDLKICDLGLARGFELEDENKTEYVVTRWYRAPERSTFGVSVAFLLNYWDELHLFPGKDYLEQIQRIIAVLGTPQNEEMKYITNEGAIKYIKSLPKRTKQNFNTLFPKVSASCLDLLSKMLTFSPNQRYTVEQCLNHSYFDGLHSKEDEPVSDQYFDWSWDKMELKKEVLQSAVYDESVAWQSKHRINTKKH